MPPQGDEALPPIRDRQSQALLPHPMGEDFYVDLKWTLP